MRCSRKLLPENGNFIEETTSYHKISKHGYWDMAENRKIELGLIEAENEMTAQKGWQYGRYE